jgi:hypothetical protein
MAEFAISAARSPNPADAGAHRHIRQAFGMPWQTAKKDSSDGLAWRQIGR